MNDPLLVGVLNGPAELTEQVEAVGHGEPMGVAVIGQRDAGHELHHEKRPAVRGDAGVQHFGNVRVVHQGEGLTFRLEPGQHGPRIHPRLNQLDRHRPLHRLHLLGPVHRAHAALTDRLKQLIPPGEHGHPVPG